MNNSYAMSVSLESKHRTQASMITAGFAIGMILLMFLLKWKLPVFEKITEESTIEVQLADLPEPPPPPASRFGGGGGGGNPVQAPGKAGLATPTPEAPGETGESKDIETADDKDAAPIVKPSNPKPKGTKIENTSTVKTPPKPIETPARTPKNVYKGNTNTGTSNGGNEATTYERNGGRGTGLGVGNGGGTGGGTGNGTGGGNGTGTGTGTGPRRVSGSRVVINPKNMDAGENLQGKVLAEIRVSPDGVGTFVRTTRGSTYTSGQAIEIIREWLRRNRFNKIAEESLVVYEFRFSLGG